MKAAALFALTLGLTAFAATARAEVGWGAGVEVMSEADMGVLRGGLAVAPGLEVNFAAVITTYVNDAPALTTNLTWTDTGTFVSQTIGQAGENINNLTPDQRTQLGLVGLENADGVLIADTDGVTALVHNINDGALQNIIINTATGRDLSQAVDITLTLPGFEAAQDSLLLERFSIRLDDDLRSVALSALP